MRTQRLLCACLALLLAAASAAGCSPERPGHLSDDPAVRRAKESPGPRMEGAVALAPIEVAYRWRLSEAEEEARAQATPERHPFALDVPLLEREVAAALVGESPIRRIDPLDPIAATRPATTADYLALAHERGDESLLSLRIRDARGEFRGRNIFFWPNLLLWYVLWVPSFFPQDEDYACAIDAEAMLHDVVSERPLARADLRVDVERALDDFDRGWDILGLWYLPHSLDAANWAKVRETLLPIALHELRRDLVLRAHDTFAPAAATRPASVLGLVVDVARYEKEPAVTSSPSCAEDGRAFHEALTTHARVPAKNLARLSGKEALRHRIEDDLRNRVARRARAQDTILLYFAGAGTTGPDGQCRLLPYDADPSQPLELTSISLARLGALLAPSRARRLVVVLDASFSNERALGRSVRIGPENGGGAAAPRLDDLAAALPGWSVHLLLACDADEGAGDLAGAGRGLFSHYLTQAVQSGPAADRNRDGAVSSEELLLAVREKVSLQAGVDGRKQTPRLLRRPAARPGAPADREAAAPWLPTLSSR